MPIIVISFDGVGDTEFEKIAADPINYPNIAKFKRQSFYQGSVKTVFVSNTYPIHTTISTGKLPKDHGVISNYVGNGAQRRWVQHSKHIKTQTIWDAARKRGLSTAAIIWPVTYGAKIKWNIPEIHVKKGEKQDAFKRSRELKCKAAVYLDCFSACVARYLIKSKRPDLTLIHLVAYDTIRHAAGSKPGAVTTARKSLDNSLGKILDAAEGHTVLVFSDHTHLDVAETIDLKRLFGANVYEQCGGSAFLKKPINNPENYPWFKRSLTQEEMKGSGYSELAAFGVAAKPGYNFGTGSNKSDHGYPADYENYKVFYAVRGAGFSPNTKITGAFGDIRDITAIIDRNLGLGILSRSVRKIEVNTGADHLHRR